MTSQGYSYLDVRTVEEFDTGHPHGAFNVPLQVMSASGMVDNPHFVADVRAVFANDDKLVLGCRSGNRSQRALTLLEEHGFSTLVEQRAGMEGARDAFGRVREPGWRAAGLPVSIGAEHGRAHADIAARRMLGELA
jgi:rhodanese-related sulfurtransferase